MKILFIGLGSIGQRHLRNAKKIFKTAKFYALRFENSNKLIKDTKFIKCVNLENYFKIKNLNNYNQALKLKPNLTFICNPSSKHLKDAIKFAQNGSNLFIEKPLGRSKSLEKKLKNILNKKKLISMIGYQMRFHPIIKKLKLFLKDRKFGKIIYANFKFLTFLPNHHKYENFKNSYAARRKLGGGVLDSLVHEVDLIAYLFGLPLKQTSIKNNSDFLKINCEENFCSLMNYKIGKNIFNVFLRLSFTQFKEERNISILFEKALIKICLINNEIKIYSNDKKNIKKIKFKLNRNELFYKQLINLKKSLKLNKNPETSVTSNINTQKLFLKLIK